MNPSPIGPTATSAAAIPTAAAPGTPVPRRVAPPGLSARALRPLLGASVVVRTTTALWRGTLVSCVRDSAWFVVDDADVVVRLGDLLSVRTT